MEPSPITFYFDYLSPYSYVAWTQLPTLAKKYGRDLRVQPILLAAILNHHGQKGPAEIPAKRLYVFQDLLRTSQRLGIPFQAPPAHPFSPLLALRLTLAVTDYTKQFQMVTKTFNAIWVEGKDAELISTIDPILEEIGLDSKQLQDQAQSPELKTKLRMQSEQAIHQGIFGVPSMMVDNQLFWGLDSLPNLEHYLENGDVIDAQKLATWVHLPRTAVRKPPTDR
jgi:2-hydroxychromene-2-carboxylate isomerase